MLIEFSVTTNTEFPIVRKYEASLKFSYLQNLHTLSSQKNLWASYNKGLYSTYTSRYIP